MNEMTITVKDLATELNTDPRTTRKFLRSEQGLDMKVGKGQRWTIEAKQVRSLKARYAKWDAARTPTPEVEVEATDD
jgi:hypothetical protein